VDSILGRVSITRGSITIAGKSGITLSDCPPGTVGYVPQQDILLHTLTVREVLEHRFDANRFLFEFTCHFNNTILLVL